MQTRKNDNESANERVRLQVDMTKERLDGIDKLVTITGMASRKELLDNALTLMAWAIRETRCGNLIASMNRSDNSFREVTMPCLHYASENEFLKAN
ncbi:MAG: hypothetical protein EOP09_00355 [Proteobacteria bacterium]|nr:MAG: hypothetical protein EOP09_00355 [Pseudomonadota bacterium]